ncbi:hypothetical protein G7046_g5128 [Stylonectria norvegica]|nr:hypothetical protein G7046_g5128 [Stylonectria norvegica]
MVSAPALAAMNSARSFTLFSQLPIDVRLMIWEFCLPTLRATKIGCYSGDRRRSRAYASEGIIAMQPPKALLRICHESRQFAFTRGYFYTASCNGLGSIGEAGKTWMYRDIQVVYTSTHPTALAQLRRLPSNIQTVACLWPKLNDMRGLEQCLLERAEEGIYEPVKRVYIGISAIVYDVESSARNEGESQEGDDIDDGAIRSLYGESGFSVVALDDTRLPGLLSTAYDVARAKSIPSLLHHRSPTCFLENLRRYWENGPQSRAVRSSWISGAVLDLKSAIIFGKEKDALFFGDIKYPPEPALDCGLLFTKQDVPKYTFQGGSARFFAQCAVTFDCKTRCCNH